MKKSIRRFCSSVVIFAILMSLLSLSAYATEFPISLSKSVEQEAFSSEDLFISSDLAKRIALLFVVDMVSSGTTNWTTSTCPVDVITMYDGSDEQNIVAYTVEMDSGYVVVSAYIDVPNIILEWSDKAFPLYRQFALSQNDNVVYGGALHYYKDNGSDDLQTLGGGLVNRNDVISVIKDKRNAVYIPETFISLLISEKTRSERENAGGRNVGPYDNVIENPFDHASTWYNGPYECHDWTNYWEPNNTTVECHSALEYSNLGGGYVNHCGPTAITNMLIIYGNRFNISSITSETDDDIFVTVAGIGISHSYYFNSNFINIGTLNGAAGWYIYDSFAAFNVTGITINGRYGINYSNVSISLGNDRLLYLLLDDNDCYGDHHVTCYAYTRLQSTTDGNFVTYLKVADGWSDTPRYIDINSVDDDQYWEVEY